MLTGCWNRLGIWEGTPKGDSWVAGVVHVRVLEGVRTECGLFTEEGGVSKGCR